MATTQGKIAENPSLQMSSGIPDCGVAGRDQERFASDLHEKWELVDQKYPQRSQIPRASARNCPPKDRSWSASMRLLAIPFLDREIPASSPAHLDTVPLSHQTRIVTSCHTPLCGGVYDERWMSEGSYPLPRSFTRQHQCQAVSTSPCRPILSRPQFAT
jgi:hypothetical protein